MFIPSCTFRRPSGGKIISMINWTRGKRLDKASLLFSLTNNRMDAWEKENLGRLLRGEEKKYLTAFSHGEICETGVMQEETDHRPLKNCSSFLYGSMVACGVKMFLLVHSVSLKGGEREREREREREKRNISDISSQSFFFTAVVI